MTLGIVKRTEEDFAEWLATEGGFLAGLGVFDGEPIVLEPYQLPRDRQLVAQIHAIKRRVLPSGNVDSTPSARRRATSTSFGRWRSPVSASAC